MEDELVLTKELIFNSAYPVEYYIVDNLINVWLEKFVDSLEESLNE